MRESLNVLCSRFLWERHILYMLVLFSFYRFFQAEQVYGKYMQLGRDKKKFSKWQTETVPRMTIPQKSENFNSLAEYYKKYNQW